MHRQGSQSLFFEAAQPRLHSACALAQAYRQGLPETISGNFFRVWMDVKAALTGKDRKAILNSCEFGEDAAVDTYKNALRNNLSDITAEQQTMLNAQHALIKADHDKIKSMRDALIEA